MNTQNVQSTDSFRLEHARVLGRLARRALDDEGVRSLADQLMRRMDTMDPDSAIFARFAACVVELSTAPPKTPTPVA